MFISVVLPLPDAPTIATYSPRSMRRLTPAERVHRDVADGVGLVHVDQFDHRRAPGSGHERRRPRGRRLLRRLLLAPRDLVTP